MNNPTQLFIIGGGKSVQEGIPLGLWEKLNNKFVISLNKTCDIFSGTFICFVDAKKFYKRYIDKLTNFPLIIGKYDAIIKNIKLNNTILLPFNNKYRRDLSGGVYHPYLAGIFSLSLAIYLLDVGQIFLLGFDGGIIPPKDNVLTIPLHMGNQVINAEAEDMTFKFMSDKNKLSGKEWETFKKENHLIEQNEKLYRLISHFYQGKIEHLGIGKVNFYYNTGFSINKLFSIYKNETQCQIYNVSPQSNLTTFPKITYEQMFNLMDKEEFNQPELREWVKQKIGGLNGIKN